MNSPLDAYSKADLKIKEKPSPTEQVVKEILSTRNIKTKTDLNDNLVVALTKGTIYASVYKSPLMQMLVDNVSLYRVSLKRQGRTELKEMVRSLSSVVEEEKRNMSVNQKLFGG